MTTGSEPSRSSRAKWAEILAAVILSITVVATAWSAFQAGKWGGAMTVSFNEASIDRTIAAADIAQASRDISGDRANFGDYVLALSAGDERTAEILFVEFRDEVQPLITDWLIRDPFGGSYIGSPFDTPDYLPTTTLESAVESLATAEMHTTEALDARGNVGDYTLMTVLFAVVLFLAGLSRQFRSRISLALTAIAATGLVVGLAVLVVLPTLL
jgi:hypothetical protein